MTKQQEEAPPKEVRTHFCHRSFPFAHLLQFLWAAAGGALLLRLSQSHPNPKLALDVLCCGNGSQEFMVSGIELINRPFRQIRNKAAADNRYDDWGTGLD